MDSAKQRIERGGTPHVSKLESETENGPEVSTPEEVKEIKLADLHRVDMPDKIKFLDVDEILLDENLNLRRFGPVAAEIKDLAKNIVSRGQLYPVIVRKSLEVPGKYALVDGNQRTKAILHANREKMTAEPIKVAANIVDLSNAEAFAASVATFKRFGLSAVGYASIIQRAHDVHGIAYKEIAKELGKDPGWVSRAVSLLKLRPKIQKLVHEGAIPFTTASEMVELGEEEQDKIVEEMQTVKEPGKKAKVDVRAAQRRKKKAAKGESLALSMKEATKLFTAIAGLDEVPGSNGEYVGYAPRVQKIGKLILKALEGRMSEKALAGAIDRAFES
jgi:ParB/RepB/Spo0J family partition protein